jgi:hypothetical protein
VHVVEVQPQEEGLLGGSAHELERLADDRPGLALPFHSLAEAVLRVQGQVHARSRAPAVRGEHLGQRHLLLREQVPGQETVVADLARREEQGVRRWREAARAEGVREAHGLLREGVEVRAGRAGVAVAAEVVRAQEVDRDHDHVDGAAPGRRGHGPQLEGERRRARVRSVVDAHAQLALVLARRALRGHDVDVDARHRVPFAVLDPGLAAPDHELVDPVDRLGGEAEEQLRLRRLALPAARHGGTRAATEGTARG